MQYDEFTVFRRKSQKLIDIYKNQIYTVLFSFFCLKQNGLLMESITKAYPKSSIHCFLLLQTHLKNLLNILLSQWFKSKKYISSASFFRHHRKVLLLDPHFRKGSL